MLSGKQTTHTGYQDYPTTGTRQNTEQLEPFLKSSSSSKWVLTLYIAGPSHPKSVAAYANLKQICEEHLPGPYELHVVDVAQKPERAVEDQILAIPTLIRNSPQPVRKIIGDLGDTNRVLISLEIPSQPTLR